MSPGRQIGTSPGWSNRIFRGCPGDVGGGRPRNVLGTNICQLGVDLSKLSDAVKNDVVKKDVYNAKIKNIEDKIPDLLT